MWKGVWARADAVDLEESFNPRWGFAQHCSADKGLRSLWSAPAELPVAAIAAKIAAFHSVLGMLPQLGSPLTDTTGNAQDGKLCKAEKSAERKVGLLSPSRFSGSTQSAILFQSCLTLAKALTVSRSSGFAGNVDADRLQRSWKVLVFRHDMLRTILT